MLRGIRAGMALALVFSLLAAAPVAADPGDPGEPIQLSAEMQPLGQVIGYRLSPDRQWAVYVADQDFDGSFEIFSVSTSGGPVTRLNPPFNGTADVTGFEISPDSQYVVYLADPNSPRSYEVYLVPIGGGQSHRLHDDLATPAEVWRPMAILPDSSRAIFLAPEEGANGYRLLSAALDGSDTIELADVVGFDSEHAFEVTSDGGHIVFRARSEDGLTWDLYMVPSAGGLAQRISVDLEPDARVEAFDEGGGYVVYAAQANGEDTLGIYVYPGSSGPPQASYTLADGERVRRVDVADDASFVSFTISGDGVFGMNPAGGPVVRLSGPGITTPVAPVLTQGRIIYRGTAGNARYDLYSASRDGSDVVRLNGGLADEGVDPDFHVAGGRVVFASPDSRNGAAALYSVPVAGGEPIPLSPEGMAVWDQETSLAGDVVAFTGRDAQGSDWLYLVPATGGHPMPLAETEECCGMIDPRFAAEDRLIFRGTLDAPGHVELWMVRTSAAAPQCLGRNATIVGTDGDDVIEGTPGPDVIWAGPGDDVVLARGGNDIVCGGPGHDQLAGNGGRDLLVGGAGDDVIRGGFGRDRLRGNRGADDLAGQRGADTLRGAAGADSLSGGMHIDRCFGGADVDAATGCENVTAVP